MLHLHCSNEVCTNTLLNRCQPRSFWSRCLHEVSMDCVVLLTTGFFGRILRRATENLPVIESAKKDCHALREWAKRLIRFVFFLNAAIGIALLTHLTTKQDEGSYRCTKIVVAFGDDIWDQAFVTTAGENRETKLLIYSHFNGIYEEEGKACCRYLTFPVNVRS